MLSMTMRKGDYLMLGDDVRLTFDRSKGAAEIYFSIDAPRDVKVLRGEVYERNIEREAERKGDQAALEQLAADRARRARALARRREERAEMAQTVRERKAVAEQGAQEGGAPC